MISIIICSINASFLRQIKNNIAETISTEFEILSYNNTVEKKGICEVYNEMAKQASFPFMCFVHEDVLFKTNGWGQKIESIFLNRPEVGVIGVAGSRYKSNFYSGWFTGVKEFDCANIIHRYNHGDEQIYLAPPGSDRQQDEVICLDGVFICTRKEVWEQISFNHKLLKGFHFYDIDFSLRAARLCDIIVTYEIEIIHITTGGDFDNKWVETAFVYHHLNNKFLPFTKLGTLPAGADELIVKTWLDVLKKYNISWKNKYKWVTSQQLLSKRSFYCAVNNFLFYTPFGLKHLHNLFKSK